MLLALLQQTAAAGLPPAVLIALALAVAASLLALLVSIRIARRIRAIGEAGQPSAITARDQEPAADE